MLNVLQFDLMVPSSYDFVKLFCHRLKVTSRTKNLSDYLCELTLLHGDVYLSRPPSKIAAASVALARYAVEVIEFIIHCQLLPTYMIYG